MKSLKNSFVFHLGNLEFPVESTFEFLLKIQQKPELANIIMNNRHYYVKSNVQKGVFELFLNYWQNGTIPEINFDNIWEYFQLSHEFGLMQDIIMKPQYKSFFKLSILIHDDKFFDKTEIEEYVAANFIYYLKKQKNDLKKVPITSLYNIFHNKNFNVDDHDLLYEFIVEIASDENPSLFVLLKCLDGKKMKKIENLRESVIKRENHCGFYPKNSEHLVLHLNSQLTELELRNQQLETENSEILDELKSAKKQIESLLKENAEIKKLNESLSSKYDQASKSYLALKEKYEKDSCEIEEEEEEKDSTEIEEEEEEKEEGNIFTIDFFNSFTSDVQQEKISHLVELEPIYNLLLYLNKFKTKMPKHYIKIETSDKKKSIEYCRNCQIVILHQAIEILYINKKFISQEFVSLISNLNRITFEIKFPSKSFNSIFDCILNLEVRSNLNFSISVFITGIEKVGLDLSGNQNIHYIRIDSSVSEFEKGSFSGCCSLSKVEIPSSISVIKSSLFYSCSCLSEVNIPSSVKEIESYAFSNCSNLSKIDIPNSVIKIGDYAFEGCNSLEKIKLPISVTEIGIEAFPEKTKIVH